jgi:hypothetical protein
LEKPFPRQLLDHAAAQPRRDGRRTADRNDRRIAAKERGYRPAAAGEQKLDVEAVLGKKPGFLATQPTA